MRLERVGAASRMIAAVLAAGCGSVAAGPDGGARRDGPASTVDAHDGRAGKDAFEAACPATPSGACTAEGEACPGLCGTCTCTAGTWQCPEPPCAQPCRGEAPSEGTACGDVCCGPYVGETCEFSCGDGGQVSATCTGASDAAVGVWHLLACHGPDAGVKAEAGKPDAAGTLAVGSACTADEQCASDPMIGAPSACLGGMFTGGYCVVLPAECSGGDCPTGTACVQGAQAPDVDGGAIQLNELCAKRCTLPGDCRSGYACCDAAGGTAPESVCVPTSLCLKGG